MRNSQNWVGFLGQRKVMICSPHTQVVLAAAGEQWCPAVSAVLWCLWGFPAHLFLAYAQDVSDWSSFCAAAQPSTLAFQFRLPFGGFYHVGTSVNWCWEHQLRSPETWAGHGSYHLDPDECQSEAGSEVFTCPSQGGDVSHFPAQDNESSRAPGPAKWWFRQTMLGGDWHLFVLHVMWMPKFRRQTRLLLPRVNQIFPWLHRA